MKFKFFFKKKRRRKIALEYTKVVKVNLVSDIPEINLGKTIYLVGNEEKNKWVIFECPGGHHKRIEVNLMKNRRPNWNAEITAGKITLFPSIAVDSEDCNCHFWLEDNIAYKAIINL
jgi:hypothetical protein